MFQPSRRDRLKTSRRASRLSGGVVALLALAAFAPEARADDRTEARRHFKSGMELVRKGRYEDGARELEAANAILPHPDVTFNIAQAYAKAGKLDKAIGAYKLYLASDPPDRADVLLVVADLQKKLDGREHFTTGMGLIAKGKYDDGVKELEKANEIAPHPDVLFNIARAYAEAGNLEKAIGAYREYLATSPKDDKQVEAIVADLQTRLDAQKAVAKVNEPATPKPAEPAPQPEAKPAPHEPEPAAKAAPTNAGAPSGLGERDEDVYQETVVTASRGAQSPLDSPNSTTIITKQDIRLSGITRIPELLRRVAGMDVMQTTGGDENISMRGFNGRFSNKVLVLVNGRSVYNDILGSTLWESLSIDVDQVERIEVVRGPGSALYGADAFSGVVNIITIAPGEGKSGVRMGYGDHEQAYGSAWVTGRDGDFAYRGSVGYTRYPRWTQEVAPGRVDVVHTDTDQTTGAQNLRADLRGSRRVGKGSEVYLGGGYARSDLDIYGIGPFNDYWLQADNSDVTGGFKSPHFDVRVYWTRLNAHAQANPAYLGHTIYETAPLQNSVDAEIEYKDNFKFPEALRHDIHVGLGYRLKTIQWSYLQSDIPAENHGSAYIQDTIKIGKSIDLVGSGRADYVPYLQRIIGSPRGSVIVKPTDRQAIRFSGSAAFRTPTFLESYLNLPIQLPVPGVEIISSSLGTSGTNKVQPERITTAEVGYLNQQSDYFEFELNAYYNRITGLIVLAEAAPLTLSEKAQGLGGIDPATGQYTAAFGGWANECDTYNVFGGELGARAYPVEGLDLFANYALNISNQSRPPGCAVPDDRRTSRNKINAGVQVRSRTGLNGELSFHYSSPQIWREQVASLDGIHYELFPLPAYTLVNARVGYRFYDDHAEVSATVFNALSGVFSDPPQMHPFGNQIGRRFMGFFTYSL